MRSIKLKLLSTAVIPAFVGVGLAFIPSGTLTSANAANASSQLLPAAKTRTIELASSDNPCNPCAAKKNPCNPCNPCAAKNPCNPCNPCAAKNPCNPCNPCAAKSPCNPCNPCAAKNPCNPCNPCAAKNPCNPCNPCAAKNPCNPCNPCAAKSANYSKSCVVPRLASANPCNPCAAKNPCNPCAAKNPCNPCAAKNPCNPCGASNPCNPCGAGAVAELSGAEATAAYNCLKKEMAAAYGKAGLKQVNGYTNWLNIAKEPYQSGTHGGRYVNNYVDSHGDYRYKKFENAGTLPLGTVLAKDSFTATPNGKLSVGPLFIMEKMSKGYSNKTGDWKYTMVMPNGKVAGTTKGKGLNMQFCADCHATVAPELDYILLVPEEYRKKF